MKQPSALFADRLDKFERRVLYTTHIKNEPRFGQHRAGRVLGAACGQLVD